MGEREIETTRLRAEGQAKRRRSNFKISLECFLCLTLKSLIKTEKRENLLTLNKACTALHSLQLFKSYLFRPFVLLFTACYVLF